MRDCRSPSSAVREHLTLMGPNFRSRLPKSVRSRRWTFESAPQGRQTARSCSQQQFRRPMPQDPPGVPSRAAAHTDLLPLKVSLLTVALVVVVPTLNPIRPASPREATSSPQTVWPRRYSHQGVKEKAHLRGQGEDGRTRRQDSRPLREEGRLDTCSLGWGSRPPAGGWYTAGALYG